MNGPVTETHVTGYVGLADGADPVPVGLAVAAVNERVTEWHGDPAEWGAAVLLGAVMLAARLYRRRNSSSGVESFGELGAVYVQRNDPDIAQMLKIGPYTEPRCG